VTRAMLLILMRPSPSRLFDEEKVVVALLLPTSLVSVLGLLDKIVVDLLRAAVRRPNEADHMVVAAVYL